MKGRGFYHILHGWRHDLKSMMELTGEKNLLEM